MLFWILIYDMWPCIALWKMIDFPPLTCIFWNSMTLCLEWTFLFHLLFWTLVDKILSRWQNTEAFSLQLFIPWSMYLVGEFQEMRRREQKSRNSSSRHTSEAGTSKLWPECRTSWAQFPQRPRPPVSWWNFSYLIGGVVGEQGQGQPPFSAPFSTLFDTQGFQILTLQAVHGHKLALFLDDFSSVHIWVATAFSLPS